MNVIVREKSSQGEKSHFFALRDDNSSFSENYMQSRSIERAKLYKNRQVCLITRRGQ